jgi:hypothetical protein
MTGHSSWSDLHVWSIIGGGALLAERAEERPDAGSKAPAHPVTFSEEASWRDRTRRGRIRSSLTYDGVSLTGVHGGVVH